MERVPLTRVIFEGRKTFWKTKNAINIIMVDHGLWDVIEIATFDPILMVESQRLYVNRKLLQEILCPLEPKTVFSLFNDTFERNAKEQLLVEFLFNSLIISEYLPVSKAFKILIKAGFLEHGVEAFVHHERPVNLIPFPEVSSTRSSGIAAGENAKPSQSLREKMRIPLIFARLMKGQAIKKDDQRIWIEYSIRQSREDLFTHVATALAESMPEEAPLLLSATLNSKLPEQCPFPSRSMCASPRKSLQPIAVSKVVDAASVPMSLTPTSRRGSTTPCTPISHRFDQSSESNELVSAPSSGRTSPSGAGAGAGVSSAVIGQFIHTLTHALASVSPFKKSDRAALKYEADDSENAAFTQGKDYEGVWKVQEDVSTAAWSNAEDSLPSFSRSGKPSPLISAATSYEDLEQLQYQQSATGGGGGGGGGALSLGSIGAAVVGGIARWGHKPRKCSTGRVVPTVPAWEEGDCEHSVQSGGESSSGENLPAYVPV
eukprot:CAMPEP_0170370656 /NCGR_PEP_ID=MMETSP0117_2-20130122/8624_1 /TAXON_ID=400756 /ORGANISM="Durinskia baltica, Strain CSIRO CS-38" /LENGTH=487 /DNA_ID=CAMNT_0010625439 /DNA_START=129 /DNA_END=1592 /DNA_ORIENTATION=-